MVVINMKLTKTLRILIDPCEGFNIKKTLIRKEILLMSLHQG